MFADIDFSNSSSFIFKVNHIFIEKEDNPSEKVVKDEVDGVAIDGIRNLWGFNTIKYKVNFIIKHSKNVL